MSVNRAFTYFAIAVFLNANVIICGSLLNDYIKGNTHLSLLDLLERNDLDIRRIDSNEAENLVKSIVKENRINNGRQNIIPLQRIIPPDYELARDKINEGVIKNSMIEDLLGEDLLNGDSHIDGLIPPDYELVKGIAKKNDNKLKNSIDRVIPPDYELPLAREINKRNNLNNPLLQMLLEDNLLLKKERKHKNLIPPDYELVGNRDIPSDYELVRHKKIKRSIPPDYELFSNRNIAPDYELIRNGKVNDLIPPDYELVSNRDIPPDYELVRDRKIKSIIPPDYELIRYRNIPPDYELLRNAIKGLIQPNYELVKNRDIPPDYGKLKDFIPPDYELVNNKDIPPDYELVRNVNIRSLIPPDYELVKNRDIPPDYELVRDRKAKSIIPPDYELSRDRDIPPDYEFVRKGIKGLIPPDYELVKENIIPPDYELVRNRKNKGIIPPDYELGSDGKIKVLRIPPDNELLRKKLKHQYIVCKLARNARIKSLIPADDETIANDDTSTICLEENLGNALRELSSILVKTLIPSDYDTPLNKYDHKNKKYFKPLKRLPVNNNYDDDELIFVRSTGDENLLGAFSLFDKPYGKSKRYKPLTRKEEKTALNLVKHIQYLVTKIESPELKKLALESVLDVLNTVKYLRQGNVANEQPENNPPALSAYVPFFNYWTYQKTIVEDDCPGDSVKIGNVCGRTPLHRSGKHKELRNHRN